MFRGNRPCVRSLIDIESLPSTETTLLAYEGSAGQQEIYVYQQRVGSAHFAAIATIAAISTRPERL